MLENLQKINENLLNYFNSFLDYDFLRLPISYMADLPIFILPIFLLSFWLYYSNKKHNTEIKNKLLFIFWSVVLGIIISLTIQHFVTGIERPEKYIENAKNLIMNHVPDASFPSDHATVSIAFLTSLLLFGFRKYAYFFSSFIILMLLSRIITALHWPFDILVGTFVGMFSAFIIYKLRKNKFLLKINDFIINIMGYFGL